MKTNTVVIAKKILADMGGSAFIGSGKLTGYKNKGDSWILGQIDKGLKRGIKLNKDETGQWNIDGYKKYEPLIANVCKIVDKLAFEGDQE